MAIYVTSDAHGHVRALDRALELAAPSSDDIVYVLGDMIDRGPDPLGVVRTVKALPNVHVLMGNHERLMLDALLGTDDLDIATWDINGGWATSAQLDGLPREEFLDFLDWVRALPLYDVVEAAVRRFILVHAGIDSVAARTQLLQAGIDVSEGHGADAASIDTLRDMLAQQNAEDLLWVRAPFWGEPTGLVGADGSGPVVIAGHTPSISLARYTDHMENSGLDGDAAHGIIVPVGATDETAGVPDRFDIDCSAATGCEFGAVGVMRLDDGATWYAKVQPDE